MAKAKKASPKRKSQASPKQVQVWVGVFLTVYLLYPGWKGYTGISAAKTLFFYLFTGALVLLGIWLLAEDFRAGRRVSLTPAQLFALGFWGFTLLSAAFSPYGAKAWYNESAHEAALTVSLYVLLFLIVSRWGKPSEALFRVLTVVLGLFCLLCLLQALGLNPLGLYPKGMNFYDGYGVKYKGAYAGTIGNVDIVSAFLALTAPMVLLYSLKQKPRQAWPLWVLCGVCLFVLIWIRVLCGLVGLAGGAVIILLVLCPDRQRKWLLLGFGLLALGLLALLWAVDLPIGLFHELHEILHGRFQDSFGTGRFYIWRQMLARIPERLWLGVGPDAARFSGLEPFIRYDEAGKEVARATITDAHCYPLHILYCQGLPALLCWLGAVGAVLVHWVRARRDRAAAILGGGLACFLCAMLFCFSSVIVMPFFWLAMGLLEGQIKYIEKGIKKS